MPKIPYQKDQDLPSNATTRCAPLFALLMKPFNENFDEKYTTALVKCVQDANGCFACNALKAKLRCSRCKVAVCEFIICWCGGRWTGKIPGIALAVRINQD